MWRSSRSQHMVFRIGRQIGRRVQSAVKLTMPTGRAGEKMARMLLVAPVLVGTGVAAYAQNAGEPSTILSPNALREIAQVEAEIDRMEAETLARVNASPDNQPQQVELLGKAMLYDKQLSVNRND